jgi:type IV pilus assembly protein PilC
MIVHQLVILEGRDAGQVHSLEGPQIVLGRPGSGMENTLEFEEPSVSRVHAILSRCEETETFEISNRSFTNPVRVDGVPASGRIRLTPGARIQMGSLVAEYRRFDSEEQTARPEEFTVMGVLELLGDGRPTARYQVTGKRTLIGRASHCDIVLESTAVSRLHASLHWIGRNLVLQSLTVNSTTLVNGQPIPQGASLGPRDLIILGGEVYLRWVPQEIMEEEEERWREAEAKILIPTVTPTGAPPATSASWAARLGDFLFGAPLSARINFLEALRTKMETGGSIATAVTEAGQTTLPRQAPGLAQGLLAGESLSESMKRYPGTFGAYETSMVRAGEEAGTLDSQLRVLEASLKETLALRRSLQDHLRWPLVGSAGVVMLALLPLLLRQGFQKWILAVLSTLAASLVLLAVLGLLIRIVYSWHPLRLPLERLLARTSTFGQALRLQVGARFLEVFGSLLASGLSLPRAAQLAARCTGSLHYESHLLQSVSQLGWGASVQEVLSSVDFFPEEVFEQIGQGEDEGRLPALLAQTAGDLQRRARAETEKVVGGLFLVCLGMGLLLLLLGLTTNHLLLF